MILPPEQAPQQGQTTEIGLRVVGSVGNVALVAEHSGLLAGFSLTALFTLVGKITADTLPAGWSRFSAMAAILVIGAVLFTAALLVLRLILVAISRSKSKISSRMLRGWVRGLRGSNTDPRLRHHIVRLGFRALQVPVIPFRRRRAANGKPVDAGTPWLVLLPRASSGFLELGGSSRAARAEAASAHSEEVSCFRRPWIDTFKSPGLIDFVCLCFSFPLLLMSMFTLEPDAENVGIAAVTVAFGWRWARGTPLFPWVLDDVIVSPKGLEITRLARTREFPFERSSIVAMECGPWWLVVVERSDGACARRVLDDLGLASILVARRAWERRKNEAF